MTRADASKLTAGLDHRQPNSEQKTLLDSQLITDQHCRRTPATGRNHIQ